ncbi:inner membrane-spanning protein YciB [Phenylobacterium sp.]|uniref:inner membrane-spanning protein YciB n=1 Tax=Phenylobacterium sp. TaxID=1871053 RepID=UPI002C16AF68|nr:septation protein IspZ [Phenylobacterium sp.]HLZ73745.1 septation protein IspZ [Phenylobacterium sp.]
MKNLLFAIRPLALDLMSTLVFVGLSALTGNVMLATAVAIAAGAARVAWQLSRREHVNAMQWMSLGLVLVTGGATLITHNPRFMMAKPSVVYVLVGLAMLERGWMLPYLPPSAREHLHDDVMIGWGYVWAGLMFFTAALNAVVALTMSLTVWSAFIAIFPAASKISLFAVQYLAVRARAIRNARRTEAEAAAKANATDLPIAA